ncbi:MAG: heavy metal sensor histidine kinase [Candidatus Accumulibacter sp.]|uniref:heavy metal sensor histidine kinase n=1 Tax=Accumulibacter sp. TaxID=2053492 RepID=UPI00287A4173|nr:heavy metal sensor histidine kinase [Accumulibacter sp.]MDS4016077.1 heavy metal sensor histidine kinase [Accumulibacter sp.]
MKPLLGKSLTLRLTLLYAAASAGVLILLGILIGRSVEDHFEEQDIELLTGKLELVSHLLERVPVEELQSVVAKQLDDALTGHHHLLVAVYADDSRRLYANGDLPRPSELRTMPRVPLHADAAKWRGSDGTHWLGIVAQVPLRVPEGGAVSVVVGTSISHHDHFLSSFRISLWIFVACATIGMGVLGWAVVRRGLYPLRAIRDEASTITANRLHTRLPVETIPDELASVAGALNEMLSRLEESFRRLSDFSSDLAHELRTPVSNLLTQTQVTLSRARTAEEYRETLESNVEEFERLSRMVSDMLFLAKADNHQVVPNHEEVDLGAEVRDLLEFYEIVTEEKGIVLASTGDGRVQGDRLMLRRAISNLLANAVRHTPSGGEVSVSISGEDKGSLELVVENTGGTIPAEHLPRLFDRFYRVDASRQRTDEGSGLGLAITKSILAAHGATIAVTSVEGRTRFMLAIPVRGRLMMV